MIWFKPFAPLKPIVGHLGCACSCEPPTHGWCLWTAGASWEVTGASEGNHRTACIGMTSFNPDVLTPRLPQDRRLCTEMCVCVCMYVCVGGNPDVTVCLRCCPRVLSTHLKEGRKFLQLFLSTCMPLPWLSAEQTFTSSAKSGRGLQSHCSLKNASLTTCRDFQEKKKSACGNCGGLLCPVWIDVVHFWEWSCSGLKILNQC